MKLPELKKRFKNKYVIRIAAGVLTVAIAGTSYGAYTVYAEKGTATESTQQSENKAEAEEELKEVLSAEVKKSEEEIGKDETVYIVADNTGKSKEVIVSDWLKNPEGKDTLEDASDLKDIKNVKGDETFKEKDGNLTWAAKGKDIYYQGTTDKELPVEQSITYYLDGKEMSADEIAGKSGKVKIRFDYKNNVKTVETVNGKEHNVYVPFTVMTGMVLDDSFSNVEVSSGKVVSDGDKQIVVGVAMPGLSDSLKVDASDFSEDVDIPEYIEVTADVKDFSLSMSMSVMMSSLMSGTDFDEMFELDALDDAINTLSDSSTQLADGSKELADGTRTLLTAINQYTKGTQTVADGIKSAKSGSATLNENISKLSNGIGGMVSELGSKQAQYSGIADQASGGAYSAQGEENADAAVKAQYKAALTAYTKATANYYGAVTRIKSSPLLEGYLVDAQTGSTPTANTTIFALNEAGEQAFATSNGGATFKGTYLDPYTTALQNLTDTTTAMCTYYGSSRAADVFSGLSQQMAAGGLTAENMSALATGMSDLDAGLAQLENGVSTLVSNNAQLNKGIEDLTKGSNTLSEGMIKFDEEGIQKLADTYNGDVKDLVERIVAVMQAGSDYQAFSQVADGTTGSVKFITRTEGVNVKED